MRPPHYNFISILACSFQPYKGEDDRHEGIYSFCNTVEQFISCKTCLAEILRELSLEAKGWLL